MAQSGLAVELRAGTGFGSRVERASIDAPEFRLWPEEVGGAARYEAVLLLPRLAAGVRPRLEASLSPNAGVDGFLMDEFARCPSCREPFEGEADHLDVTVGAEVPLFRSSSRARPYGVIGFGVRRTTWSYDDVTSTAVAHPAESFTTTDFLGRVGLGVGFGLGSRDVSLEAALRGGPVGSGTVHVDPPPDAPYASEDVDFGRELGFDFGLTLGFRQEL